MAFATPLDNGRGDVEVSVCMETNYNQPNYEPQIDPPLFQTVSIFN